MNQLFDEEYRAFDDVTKILRSAPSDVVPQKPPASIWDSIQSQIHSESVTETVNGHNLQLRSVATGAAAGSVSEQDYEITDCFSDSAAQTNADSPSNVTAIASAKKSRFGDARMWMAAAASVVLVIGGVFWFSKQNPALETELLALEGYSGEGAAQLRSDQLKLETVGLEAPEGFEYELWLLQLDDAGELVDLESLGVVAGQDSFAVPSNVDTEVFNIVDISLEPKDGNPQHSGDSVLQGKLA